MPKLTVKDNRGRDTYPCSLTSDGIGLGRNGTPVDEGCVVETETGHLCLLTIEAAADPVRHASGSMRYALFDLYTGRRLVIADKQIAFRPLNATITIA